MVTARMSSVKEWDAALAALREVGTVFHCPRRSLFCYQEKPADQVFLVESGLVALTLLGVEGDEYWAGLRTVNSLIGTASVLAGRPYMVGLVSPCDSDIRIIRAQEFLALFSSNKEVARYVHDLQCRELCEHIAHLSGLATLRARQRLEEFLWRILPDLTLVKGRVHLPLTDLEIAKLLSVTPQHLSCIFRQLEVESLIEREKGWLRVPAPDRLFHRSTSRIS
jgi:CRP-like cAMP-binding protein